MTDDLCTFDAMAPGDADAVGGKGLSLGRMAAAGLPVPPGFCVTSAAYRRLIPQRPRDDAILASAIAAAYRKLGGGLVAVRSSATAEDGAAASFAGQQETILGVEGEDAVCDAVGRCWESLGSERAVAYRRKQGVADDGLAMAVVVQRLVPAEAAGVLFTRDPLDADGRRMLVEASWGLGESVVSGRVTPDRFHLDRATGAVLDRMLGNKPVEITAAGERPVPADRQGIACLDDGQLAELADLGRRIEAFYGDARDVEWAWAEGRFWLLQARPITAGGAAEREKVRREEMAALRARAEPGGTVWGRFNLSEVLPEPTPMTWAIVRRFMSGRGGFGLMYRDLGFDPDPALDDDGPFDLVCGRPYCNLSREARMHYRRLPFEHNFAALKSDPRKALYPAPGLNPARLGWRFWLSFPIALPRLLIQLTKAELRRQDEAKTFAHRFRDEVVPAFVREVEEEKQRDLAALSPAELLDRLEHWTRRTLVEFARDSLKPTALAALAMGKLEQQFARVLPPAEAQETVRTLLMGVRPDADADLAGAVRELSAGRLTRDDFLARFGHRGSQEMELARPRWAEEPEALAIGGTEAAAAPTDDGALLDAWQKAAAKAKLPPAKRDGLPDEARALHTFLGLREAGKHYLMMGYALIRRCLVEVDRRFHLGGGIFYLTPEELPRLIAGDDLAASIAQRRLRRTLALSLEVPPVLFSDDLDAVGRLAPAPAGDTLQGVPVSAGVAEAAALVLERPAAAPPGDFILVCPSTDPAWVPLMARARGLVMETGGVLSHGAIVAREFGVPAVVGLAGVVRHIPTGRRLRVDGTCGAVTILPE